MPSTRSLRVRATAASANKGPRTGPKANPSQTDPYPLPHPVVPLVLPSANVPLEELLARVLPDVDAQAREKAFKDMIRSEGSKKAAVALFQSVYNNLIKYPVEGAKLPPTGVALRTINIGPHAIFYHRTYPAEVEADHPFFWSFYVGCAGKGPGSIITDFSEQNIVFSIEDGRGTWVPFSTLVVLPRSTVRVSYPDNSGYTIVQEELTFPPDPRETPIASHQLV